MLLLPWPSAVEEDKRVLCQMLNKLHVPDVVDDYRIRSVKLLMDNLRAVSWPTYHILIEIEILYENSDDPCEIPPVTQPSQNLKQLFRRNLKSNCNILKI